MQNDASEEDWSFWIFNRDQRQAVAVLFRNPIQKDKGTFSC